MPVSLGSGWPCPAARSTSAVIRAVVGAREYSSGGMAGLLRQRQPARQEQEREESESFQHRSSKTERRRAASVTLN